MDKKIRLCVYFGTFNPIHNAHIQIAQKVKKAYGFDKILFVPAFVPPHKNNDLIDPKIRLKMVQLAMNENLVSDIEFRRSEPSYSWISIKKLYQEYDVEGKINFIIGYDAFSKIETWYEAQKLKDNVKFIVIPREKEMNFDKLKSSGYDFEIFKIDFMDISSFQIRELLKQRKSINGLVPRKIEEFIEKHELYGRKN